MGSGEEEGVDQVFAVKQLMEEKYCERNKCVYLAFMDLEKYMMSGPQGNVANVCCEWCA